MLQEASDKVTYMTDLEKLVKKLENEGASCQFKVDGEQLHCISNDKYYKAEDVTAVNFYRFEGTSDPSDMSILYVIETIDGNKGTLIDAYGAYADDATGAFMQSVEIFKKTNHVPKMVDDFDSHKPSDVNNNEEEQEKDPLEAQLERTARIEQENKEKREAENS